MTQKELQELLKLEQKTINTPNLGTIKVQDLSSHDLLSLKGDDTDVFVMVSKAMVDPKMSVAQAKAAPSKFMEDFGIIVEAVTVPEVDEGN